MHVVKADCVDFNTATAVTLVYLFCVFSFVPKQNNNNCAYTHTIFSLAHTKQKQLTIAPAFAPAHTHARAHAQVVVVTHTASVAALADQHLVVDKATADSRTFATSDDSRSSSSSSPGYATAVGVATPSLAAAAVVAAGDRADDSSLSARRSRRNAMGQNGGLSVSIREVQGQEREEEVARMAAGDMGGGAAAELAREMLRYSRRQRA